MANGEFGETQAPGTPEIKFNHPPEIVAHTEAMLKKFTKRLKQEFEGQQEEFFDKAVRTHRASVARQSWHAAQKWCMWDNDGPVLLPDFTRIYYKKGETEVVLQEFRPQIRLLKFSGALAKRASTSEELDPAIMGKSFTYSLALPYTIFIFKFVNGMFQEVRCAFSDRPLKRLEEKPLRPYFTNIDSTLKVCLGRDFDYAGLEKGQIAQQSAYVLDHFWSSMFSDEWGQHFWQCKSTIGGADPRMKDLDSWQAASAENSLFVVEDVNWIPNGEEQFGDMIVRMFDDDKKNREFQDALYKELSETFVDDVKKSITEMIDTIDEKILPGMVPIFLDDSTMPISVDM